MRTGNRPRGELACGAVATAGARQLASIPHLQELGAHAVGHGCSDPASHLAYRGSRDSTGE